MRVLVLGLGYVGSVAAVALASKGHEVIGVDNDQSKIKAFLSGHCPVYEPGLSDLVKIVVREKQLEFYHLCEIDEIKAPVVMICVGTPPRADGGAELSQVKNAIRWVRERIVAPATIVMKSTVPPGTGQQLIKSYLLDSPIKITYVSNPEFLREGEALQDWFHPDRIVIGGNDDHALELVCSLYEDIEAPVVITDITSAELIKYAANAFLATKISFINEIAHLCDYLGADITDVARGIGLDPRIGTGFLKAGIGYGGSCFPKDVRALDFLSMVNGYSFELLKSVINVNNRQRVLVVQKLRSVLGTLTGKIIAVLGLAFKPLTDDVREAPAIQIIRLLVDEGATVQAFDPFAMEKAKEVVKSQEVKFCSTVWDALAGAQAAVIATEWNEFINLDWAAAKEKMEPPYLIMDGRNCLESKLMIELGFYYIGVGRGRIYQHNEFFAAGY